MVDSKIRNDGYSPSKRGYQPAPQTAGSGGKAGHSPTKGSGKAPVPPPKKP